MRDRITLPPPACICSCFLASLTIFAIASKIDNVVQTNSIEYKPNLLCSIDAYSLLSLQVPCSCWEIKDLKGIWVAWFPPHFFLMLLSPNGSLPIQVLVWSWSLLYQKHLFVFALKNVVVRLVQNIPCTIFQKCQDIWEDHSLNICIEKIKQNTIKSPKQIWLLSD